MQFSTEQKLSFKLQPRASQERSEAIIILHYIIKLQKKCVTKSNMRQSIIEIGKFIVMSVDCEQWHGGRLSPRARAGDISSSGGD